jgi:adenine deaminase
VDRTCLVKAARGDVELDMLFSNVNLVNVFSCEVYPADVGIYADRIAVVGPAGAFNLKAKRVYDGSGKWAVPGFIDTHAHIESSMVTPANYAAAVLPRGTTTSVVDPHEVANVMGMDGVRYLVEASQSLPLRVLVAVPSCVPAVPGKEEAGASFSSDEIAEMLSWPGIVALGEVMDYRGVVAGKPRMIEIVNTALNMKKTIQGHAPRLSGRELNAYIAAGIDNDHEIRGGEEALEKLRLGLIPLLRVNSFNNQISNIIRGLTSAKLIDLALCTDDVEPEDLLQNGHLDRVIRGVIEEGIDPALAIRWATLNGARQYNLRDLGAIAPGYIADIVLLSSLEDVRTSEVIVGGRLIVEAGALVKAIESPPIALEVGNSVCVKPLSAIDFILPAPIKNGTINANVIALDLVTRLTRLETVTVRVKEHRLDLESRDDGICYLCVVPRHGQTHGQPSVVLLKGVDMRRGAMATSIAHDSHNILVAGRKPNDMLRAVQELEKTGGGIVIADEGRVLAKVELPLAGLLSLKTAPEVALEMKVLNDTLRHLGVDVPAPGLVLSGLALLVLPEVRVSDMGGLFDVLTQEFIPVFTGGMADESQE